MAIKPGNHETNLCNLPTQEDFFNDDNSRFHSMAPRLMVVDKIPRLCNFFRWWWSILLPNVFACSITTSWKCSLLLMGFEPLTPGVRKRLLNQLGHHHCQYLNNFFKRVGQSLLLFSSFPNYKWLKMSRVVDRTWTVDLWCWKRVLN